MPTPSHGNAESHIQGSTRNERLGSAVDFSASNAALVGASGAAGGAGQAWIYERTEDGWTRRETFQASDFQSQPAGSDLNAGFGSAVAFSDNVALVGAPEQDGTGRAFLYEKQTDGTWNTAASLPAAHSSSNITAGATFGSAVTLGTDVAVVGAPRQDDDRGKVVIYKKQSDWTEAALLAPPETLGDYPHFGAAVSLWHNHLLVGIPQATTSGQLNAGQAYLYDEQADGSWTLVHVFDPPEAEASHSRFGSAVSVLDDLVMIGAPYESPQGQLAAGRVHVFEKNDGSWQHVLSLDPPDLTEGVARHGHFGASLSLNDRAVLIGAPWRSPGGIQETGQAFLYLKQAYGYWEPSPVRTYSPPDFQGELENWGRYGAAVALGDEEEVAIGAPAENPFGISLAGRLFFFDAADLALGKRADQSSTAFGGIASRAVDGNTDGDFYVGNSVTHTRKQSQPWWEVDLGAARHISQIRIYNRTDCCFERLSKFYILVSAAPLPPGLNDALAQASWQQFVQNFPSTVASFDVGQEGRYVRVQLSGSDYLSLAEVEVY